MPVKFMIKPVVALTASVGALAAVAAAQEPACRIELNYEDADIRTVVDEIAIRTGRYFVLDPAVQGRVTIKSPPNGGICANEAWELFQAMLRANDFVATPIGDLKFRIVPLQEAARSGGRVGGDASGLDLVTEIVRLRYVDSREAAANLAQIIGASGVVSPVRSGNAIILVDTANNVERLRKVLAELDRDPTVFRRIELANASAGDVARVVSDLASEIASEQDGGRGAFSIAPVEASNSLFVRAEPTLMTRIEGVIAELDRFGGNTSNLSVVYLNHADAEELAPLLTEVANNAPGLASGEGAARVNRATVSFHAGTNALIINGDAEIQRTLQNVIAKLDIRRAQVLVEAIIVDVSERLERDLGFQYFLTGNGEDGVPFTATNFPAGPNLLPAAGAALLRGDALDGILSDDGDDDGEGGGNGTLAQQALASILGTQGGIFGGGFEFGDGNVFGAILTAIQSDVNSNILSTPSVLTLDNQTARLQVGQEIPITTGEQIGPDFQNAFRTVNREEVGVILEVTPQINEGDVVTLEISQEISSIFGAVSEGSADLITDQRVITTTALVDDGQVLVIGGLIQEDYGDRVDKIPYLGDLPGLGALFRSTSRDNERTNLMVFIRPTIIRDPQTATLATSRKLDYIRARELLRSGGPRTDIDRIIDQVTGVDRPEPAEDGPSPTVAEVE